MSLSGERQEQNEPPACTVATTSDPTVAANAGKGLESTTGLKNTKTLRSGTG